MKRVVIISETCHSLYDDVFQMESEIINDNDTLKSLGKRRPYAA